MSITKQRFAEIYLRFTKKFPYSKYHADNEELLQSYYDRWGKLQESELIEAFRKAVDTCRRFPSVAEFREIVNGGSDQELIQTAYDEIYDAVVNTPNTRRVEIEKLSCAAQWIFRNTKNCAYDIYNSHDQKRVENNIKRTAKKYYSLPHEERTLNDVKTTLKLADIPPIPKLERQRPFKLRDALTLTVEDQS